MLRMLILVCLVGALPACSGLRPYAAYQLETENEELQNRMEGGLTRDGVDYYLYHESDPRNGTEGSGWPGETENGGGVRVRWTGDALWR